MAVIVDNSSLFAEVDPAGNSSSSPAVFDNNQITTYTVHSGDTISAVAKVFGITVNTIMIANDLTSQKLTEGQHLIIFPVSGVQHTIKSGETLLGVANSYKVSSQDILRYNSLDNPSLLAVGDTIFIPSDTLPAKKTSSGSTVPASSSNKGTGSPLCSLCRLDNSSVTSLINDIGYFIEPLVHYHKTQGLHGHNGVDLGAAVGEPIIAAASGEVIISRMGWNGGYGNYVVVQHPNGLQTVYGHASKLLVSEGDNVKQGQQIALVGSTGESTGPHLHVEVRGGKNNF